jgi:hypothetical protein
LEKHCTFSDNIKMSIETQVDPNNPNKVTQVDQNAAQLYQTRVALEQLGLYTHEIQSSKSLWYALSTGPRWQF